MIYLVYESDSQKSFPATVIATFTSQDKAEKFIKAKEKTCTWEVYSVESMQVDVGDVDVIYQDGKYLNISEPYELNEAEFNAAMDEIVEELYG